MNTNSGGSTSKKHQLFKTSTNVAIADFSEDGQVQVSDLEPLSKVMGDTFVNNVVDAANPNTVNKASQSNKMMSDLKRPSLFLNHDKSGPPAS